MKNPPCGTQSRPTAWLSPILIRVTSIKPPVTEQREHIREHHGDTVNDPYEWLRDKESPEVISWLREQNAYAEARTDHLTSLREQIFSELKDRTQETDMSVPYVQGMYWYFRRTEEGKQYGVTCRAPLSAYPERPEVTEGETLKGEQVVLDGNKEAEDKEFFSLGAHEISPDDSMVAFSVDNTGGERFDVVIRSIPEGKVIDDVVKGVGYGLVWSTCGNYVWYTRVDDAWRPHQVWRHALGTTATSDVLVYEEPDEKFWMGISSSDDQQFLSIGCHSKTTSETYLVPLDEPEAELRSVCPRRAGLEYSVTSAGDTLLITHNRNNADFDVAIAPLDCVSDESWVPWINAGPGEHISSVEAFAGHIVIEGRKDGLTTVNIAPRDDKSHTGFGTPLPLNLDEEIYTIHTAANVEYTLDKILVAYQSMVTPQRVLECDLSTRELTLVREQPVLGGVDLSKYEQKRSWATTADGTRIPVSFVHHKDVPMDGTAPCVLYGYGSYEHSMEPTFSIARLSMLDRGVVWAIAHIRGGGEMGRAWYLGGKMMNKRNTFTDFITCADHLNIMGYVDGNRIAALGGSAGGLLMGAVTNLAPERFCAIHAAVPFVDNLTTILDPSLPLTIPEWEEWGDPLHDPEAYAYIKSYAPYENVAPVRHPAILATTSLNDTRVFYTEPAKWIARLQERTQSDPTETPILMRTEMVAGHGGKSGRYDKWRETAWEFSFLLDRLGKATLTTM